MRSRMLPTKSGLETVWAGAVSTTAVARRKKIKEVPTQKDSGASKSNKPSESDSIATNKKPTNSKPLVGSKRQVSSTVVSDDEDKSPPRTRQGHRKRQKAITPSGKEKGLGSSKVASPSDKASSEESPLKTASNAFVVESHNSSPDNIPPKDDTGTATSGLKTYNLTINVDKPQVSTTTVARRKKIKEVPTQKDSGASKSNKPSESDSIATNKKPTNSKPPVGSKRQVSSTVVSDDEDKSPPRTRQGHRKRQKAITPSGKEKGLGSSKVASPSDKASSEESPLKTASNAFVVESHNSSPDNIPPKDDTGTATSGLKTYNLTINVDKPQGNHNSFTFIDKLLKALSF
ncbi:uncharacterized protein LOC131643128 [Vicia villosa]|uniref:uncharacterized protein LOC131643128 n=1 Tax=Vicia villosa TaxID=3911 RepID=UPI00273AD0B5|nr:uncharacterized protein LOC131643128 [Vicia villosa]